MLELIKLINAGKHMNPVGNALPNGCGCSCNGARCGLATETSVIRYDKSTQRPCCNACGVRQNKAMNFVHGNGIATHQVAARSLCWLNQSEDVRLFGFGAGHQGNNHVAAAAAAAPAPAPAAAPAA